MLTGPDQGLQYRCCTFRIDPSHRIKNVALVAHYFDKEVYYLGSLYPNLAKDWLFLTYADRSPCERELRCYVYYNFASRVNRSQIGYSLFLLCFTRLLLRCKIILRL